MESRGRLLLLLPLLIVLLAVIGWPLLDTVWLSFTDARLGGQTGTFIWFDNYLHAFRAPAFRRALFVTVAFTVCTVGAEMLIGLGVGLLLDMDLWGRKFLRGLLIVPWALPTVVNAMCWRVIYNPDFGALDAFLKQIGVIGEYRSWLGDPDTALIAVGVADVWKTFSLVALITLAGLQAVPRELREAAAIDGAGPFARFRAVTLPVILPPLTIACVLRTIEAFKVFDIIWVMTRGGPLDSTKSLSILVYQEAFSFRHAGYGASLAMLSVAITMLLIGAYSRAVRVQGSGTMTAGQRIGRVAAYAAMILVALVILAPLGWMIVMSISPTVDLTTVPLPWIPSALDFERYERLLSLAHNSDGEVFLYALRNTCWVAAGTTVIAFLLAIPAAWVFSRARHVKWLLYLIVGTYMLPPLMFVVPLYRILASFSLLNSPWALMLADSTIVLPFTTWFLKSGFDNIPVEIEEAGAIDGAKLWKILWAITLPLAKPLIGTTLLFSALIVWDEFLYAILFTSDSRAQTLTVVIANLASGRVSDFGLLAAAGVIAAVPPVVVGLVLQRSIVSGLTSGGVKG